MDRVEEIPISIKYSSPYCSFIVTQYRNKYTNQSVRVYFYNNSAIKHLMNAIVAVAVLGFRCHDENIWPCEIRSYTM